jgi:hypothetical protein
MTMNARNIASTFVIIALASAVAACGEKSEEAASTKAPAAREPSVETTGPQAAATAAKEARLANAVVTGKSSAAVDLKYDFLAKPDVGQAFELELVFQPRAAADALEVEVSGMQGLTVVSGGTMRFENVRPGESQSGKVLAQAAAQGLYYIGVAARMVSKVQTEVRMFSIPVVVGTMPAATQKAAPQTDAAQQPIEPMPAVESGGPAAPPEKP